LCTRHCQHLAKSCQNNKRSKREMSFLYSSLTRSVARSALSRPSTFHAPRQAYRTASTWQRSFFAWKPILVGAGIAVAATLVWGPSVHLDVAVPPTQAEVSAKVIPDGTDVTGAFQKTHLEEATC
jgi:hypothetical protein